MGLVAGRVAIAESRSKAYDAGMPLTLVQLDTFRRLAALRNFSRVAEELHVTQPAVSQHVKALQDHFSVQLIDIVKRRPVFTDAGVFLAERAAQILVNAEALERDMREFSKLQNGTLRFGATVTIGTYVVPGLVAAFARRYPRLGIDVVVANTEAIVQRVRDTEIGLALVEGPAEGEDLEIVPFADDELILIVPKSGHALSKRRSVQPSELANVAFISREPGSGTRQLALHALQQAGVAPRIALELPSGEGLVRAVEAGLGVAIVPRIVVDAHADRSRLRVVRIDAVVLRRAFKFVRLRSLTPAPAAKAFTEIVLRQSARKGGKPSAAAGTVLPRRLAR